MNIKKYGDDEATVCANGNCVTVHGEAARIISAAVVALVLVAVLVYIAKLLK